jgi:hypothetical protein
MANGLDPKATLVDDITCVRSCRFISDLFDNVVTGRKDHVQYRPINDIQQPARQGRSSLNIDAIFREF